MRLCPGAYAIAAGRPGLGVLERQIGEDRARLRQQSAIVFAQGSHSTSGLRWEHVFGAELHLDGLVGRRNGAVLHGNDVPAGLGLPGGNGNSRSERGYRERHLRITWKREVSLTAFTGKARVETVCNQIGTCPAVPRARSRAVAESRCTDRAWIG